MDAGFDLQRLTFRQALSEDGGQILRFTRCMVDEMAGYGGRQPVSSPGVWSEYGEKLTREIGEESHLHLLAEFPTPVVKAVGLLVAYLSLPEQIFEQFPSLHISVLFVIPEVRRRGIAWRMIEHALEWGRQKGVREVDLHVLARNPARSLYARFGFEPFETTLVRKLEERK